MKNLLKKYSHIWTAAYVLIYVPWFIWLEKTVTTDYHPIHINLDDAIPFCEYFIIPYYLWFFYIAAGMIFLFFFAKTDYLKACAFLFTGMTIFLIICTIYPNGQDLRVDISNHNNFFAKIVAGLYDTDTNTNVFPSIHVFNSLGIMIALNKCKIITNLKYGFILKICSTILAIFIILSTMFLKQHSIIDAIGAIIMAITLYFIVYVPNWKVFSKE